VHRKLTPLRLGPLPRFITPPRAFVTRCAAFESLPLSRRDSRNYVTPRKETLMRRIVTLFFAAALLLTTAAAAAAPNLGGRVPGRLQKIILLRADPGSEVRGDMKLLEWADGRQELYVRHSLKSAADMPGSVDWTVNLDTGTYFGKRSPAAPAMPHKVQPFDLAPDPPPADAPGVKHTWKATYAVDIGDYAGGPAASTRTTIRPTWSDCLDSSGMAFTDVSDADAMCASDASTGWSTVACDRYASLGVQVYYGAPNTVRTVGQYTQSSTGDQIGSDVHLDIYNGAEVYTGFSATRRNGSFTFHEDYTGPQEVTDGGDCGNTGTSSGGGATGGGALGGPTGGSSGSGSGGGGSLATCVDVYDGATKEWLGVCCGYTTQEIVECAEGFL
jgi:hypothetical protein